MRCSQKRTGRKERVEHKAEEEGEEKQKQRVTPNGQQALEKGWSFSEGLCSAQEEAAGAAFSISNEKQLKEV